MRHTLTALLSAGAIGAFACASPALAQTVGVAPAPAPVYGYGYEYIPSHTAPPVSPAPGGECQSLDWNTVCTANPAYGYGYGPGPSGYAPSIPYVASSPASGGECDIIAGNGVCFP